MNPVLLQKQLKDNASDLDQFYRELKTWGEEMKRKDEGLNPGEKVCTPYYILSNLKPYSRKNQL